MSRILIVTVRIGTLWILGARLLIGASVRSAVGGSRLVVVAAILLSWASRIVAIGVVISCALR